MMAVSIDTIHMVEIFAHVVGYSSQGKSGLESTQNFNLLTSDAFILEKLVKEFQDQKNIGDNVVTTLDVDLQSAAYNALGDNKGAVVIMEPSTGNGARYGIKRPLIRIRLRQIGMR